MQNAYIEIEYIEDGRVVEGQCSGLAKFIGARLAKPRTEADAEAFLAWAEEQGEDAIEALKEAAEKLLPPKGDRSENLPPEIEPDVDDDEPEPDISPAEPVTTDDDPKDGWPEGVTYDRKGAYFDLTGSDGKRIDSGTPSGKFLGEDAAQEAAWAYEASLQSED